LEGKLSWGRGNTWANGTGHTSINCVLNFHFLSLQNGLLSPPNWGNNFLPSFMRQGEGGSDSY
jgi:hypothetical protein